MGRALLVIGMLLLPAAAILVQRSVRIERRIGWAFASMSSGVLLLAGALLVSGRAREFLPADAAGLLGLLLLVLAATVPWLVFATFRARTRERRWPPLIGEAATR